MFLKPTLGSDVASQRNWFITCYFSYQKLSDYCADGHNPVGVVANVTYSQGSSFVATLGWRGGIPLGFKMGKLTAGHPGDQINVPEICVNPRASQVQNIPCLLCRSRLGKVR